MEKIPSLEEEWMTPFRILVVENGVFVFDPVASTVKRYEHGWFTSETGKVDTFIWQPIFVRKQDTRENDE